MVSSSRACRNACSLTTPCRQAARPCPAALLHPQGIATTRAGCCVTSDSRVLRDPLYDGSAAAERCATVLRLAPTFLRFGSFEVCKLADKQTGAARSCGPTKVHVPAAVLDATCSHGDAGKSMQWLCCSTGGARAAEMQCHALPSSFLHQ